MKNLQNLKWLDTLIEEYREERNWDVLAAGCCVHDVCVVHTDSEHISLCDGADWREEPELSVGFYREKEGRHFY